MDDEDKELLEELREKEKKGERMDEDEEEQLEELKDDEGKEAKAVEEADGEGADIKVPSHRARFAVGLCLLLLLGTMFAVSMGGTLPPQATGPPAISGEQPARIYYGLPETQYIKMKSNPYNSSAGLGMVTRVVGILLPMGKSKAAMEAKCPKVNISGSLPPLSEYTFTGSGYEMDAMVVLDEDCGGTIAKYNESMSWQVENKEAK